MSRRLITFWNSLIEPVDVVQGMDQRRRARLLASLSLIAALSVFLIDFLLLTAEPRAPESATQFGVAFISVGVLLLNYGLSRFGYYRAVCILIVVYGSLATFAPTLLAGGR